MRELLNNIERYFLMIISLFFILAFIIGVFYVAIKIIKYVILTSGLTFFILLLTLFILLVLLAKLAKYNDERR